MADRSSYPGVPRWAKLQGIAAAILLVVVAAMSSGLIGLGGHGRSMAGHAPPESGHR